MLYLLVEDWNIYQLCLLHLFYITYWAYLLNAVQNIYHLCRGSTCCITPSPINPLSKWYGTGWKDTADKYFSPRTINAVQFWGLCQGTVQLSTDQAAGKTCVITISCVHKVWQGLYRPKVCMGYINHADMYTRRVIHNLYIIQSCDQTGNIKSYIPSSWGGDTIPIGVYTFGRLWLWFVQPDWLRPAVMWLGANCYTKFDVNINFGFVALFFMSLWARVRAASFYLTALLYLRLFYPVLFNRPGVAGAVL